MNTSIYQNIATRTAGDIYIGVVGPVRTGKSTFIKRFMETQVIPNIDNVYRKERARDELPQSGSGRTIMTAEPKFVPEEAAQIQLPDGASFSVRLIDCVGYMVKGAIGQMEDDAPRMVTTPWYDHEIPMTEAAEIGTRNVLCGPPCGALSVILLPPLRVGKRAAGPSPLLAGASRRMPGHCLFVLMYAHRHTLVKQLFLLGPTQPACFMV